MKGHVYTLMKRHLFLAAFASSLALGLAMGCGSAAKDAHKGDGGSSGSGGGSGSGGTQGSGGAAGNGGTTGTGGEPDSGPGSDAAGSDAPESGSKVCPEGSPTGGAHCSDVGLYCEYGTNQNLECNQLFQCTTKGWLAFGVFMCPPSSDCPTSYSSLSSGMPKCPASDAPGIAEDLICSFSQGTCLCSDSDDGSPPPGGPYWYCVPATAECPSPRPTIGSPCPTDGTECNYGACQGGVDIECTGGVWQENQGFTCPG
jgi:hypothetical protein